MVRRPISFVYKQFFRSHQIRTKTWFWGPLQYILNYSPKYEQRWDRQSWVQQRGQRGERRGQSSLCSSKRGCPQQGNIYFNMFKLRITWTEKCSIIVPDWIVFLYISIIPHMSHHRHFFKPAPFFTQRTQNFGLFRLFCRKLRHFLVPSLQA